MFIWLDETSVNLWAARSHVWQFKDDPLRVQLPSRGKNVTVIGALYDGKLIYQLAKSTNQKDVV